MRRQGGLGNLVQRQDTLDQSSMTSSSEYLSDRGATELLKLTPFAKGFKVRGYGGPHGADYASRFKYAYTHPSRRFAVHPERKLAIEGAPLLELAAGDVGASVSLPWAPRGTAGVPIFIGQAVTLVDIVVPPGYVYWVDGYSCNLFPSVTNELNYLWQLLVNGQDLLNRGNPSQQPQPGRPVQSAVKVPIGYDKSTMLRAQEGSRIQLIVQALNTIGASDSVAGTVFGQLEPAFEGQP